MLGVVEIQMENHKLIKRTILMKLIILGKIFIENSSDSSLSGSYCMWDWCDFNSAYSDGFTFHFISKRLI